MVVYCDSVILIYWLDHVGPYHARAKARVAALQAAADQMAVSELTRMECRVGALKRKDAAILAIFDAFFARPDVVLVPLTRTVFDRAAQVRADFGFKTPDALHLAAAVEAGCHLFLTNDARLSRFTDIPIDVLP